MRRIIDSVFDARTCTQPSGNATFTPSDRSTTDARLRPARRRGTPAAPRRSRSARSPRAPSASPAAAAPPRAPTAARRSPPGGTASRPVAAALSCDAWTRGTATEPLPFAADDRAVLDDRLRDVAWPTGVRTTRAPYRAAIRSMAIVVDTLVTTGPTRCARARCPSRAPASPPRRAPRPVSSTRPSRSPSASCTRPRSARPAFTSARTCTAVSGRGSGVCGKRRSTGRR